jgi:hypothetical protein
VDHVAGGGLFSAILSEKPDDVLADLKRQLEKRIADARRVLAQSESELLLVDQALDARRGREPPDTGAFSPGSSKTVDRERDRRPDGRFHGIPRARILEVTRTVPFPITPPRVVEAFAERGEIVNLEQIRIALNRIAKDGNLVKVGPSLFEVAAHDAPEVESPPHPAPPPSAAPTADPRDPFRPSLLGPSVRRDAVRRRF